MCLRGSCPQPRSWESPNWTTSNPVFLLASYWFKNGRMTHWGPIGFPMRGLLWGWEQGGSRQIILHFSGRALRGTLPSLPLHTVIHKRDVQSQEANTQKEAEGRASQGKEATATRWSIPEAHHTVAFLHVWETTFFHCIHLVELKFLWLVTHTAQMIGSQR